jgi:hypothetical protein
VTVLDPAAGSGSNKSVSMYRSEQFLETGFVAG